MRSVTYPSLFYGRTLGPKNEFLSSRGKFHKTGNGEILVVEIGIIPQNFIGLVKVSFTISSIVLQV